MVRFLLFLYIDHVTAHREKLRALVILKKYDQIENTLEKIRELSPDDTFVSNKNSVTLDQMNEQLSLDPRNRDLLLRKVFKPATFF